MNNVWKFESDDVLKTSSVVCYSVASFREILKSNTLSIA